MRGLLSCVTAVTFLSILSAGAATEPPPTSVQQAATESGDTDIDTVTVEARRQRELLERQLSTFVSSITMPSKTDSLARWKVPICPMVAGLPLDKGKFVFQRMSQVASDSGIPLGLLDCTPNLLIVMTREPEALLRSWWSDQPRLFNQDRGVAGIERTIRADVPVRVFYNACNVPPDARKHFVMKGSPNCGAGALGSRLTWEAVRAIYSVVIVVDLAQTQAIEIGPLTDYIAMIALAQIRRSPELSSAPTILRLFDEAEAARPKGLSVWDQVFLKSLYDTNSASVTQLTQIKLEMKQQLAR